MGVQKFLESLKVARLLPRCAHSASDLMGVPEFLLDHPDRGFESLKVARLLPRCGFGGVGCFVWGLERVVCSSIDHPDRGFESLKVARLLPRCGFGKRFDGCPGISADRGFESLKVARLLPR